ncbi:MAG: hypothetical protein LBI11_06380 [Streptococcaceae bacterium]|jgi:hypothetical protein|nr:hypothetical protein [Streptococcaceae bacterium]
MKAKYGNQIVEIWKISHDTSDSEWVRAAFDKGILRWDKMNGDVLRFPQTFGGIAPVGYYLILLNSHDYMAVTEKKFGKDFRIL